MDGNAKLDRQSLMVAGDPTRDVSGGLPPVAEHGHTSVRRASHDGHEIEIRTTYEILIDGKVFPTPIHVMDDGSVRYHGFPQYSTSSAVDLAKKIVSSLMVENPPPIGPADSSPDGDHSGEMS